MLSSGYTGWCCCTAPAPAPKPLLPHPEAVTFSESAARWLQDPGLNGSRPQGCEQRGGGGVPGSPSDWLHPAGAAASGFALPQPGEPSACLWGAPGSGIPGPGAGTVSDGCLSLQSGTWGASPSPGDRDRGARARACTRLSVSMKPRSRGSLQAEGPAAGGRGRFLRQPTLLLLG